MAVHRNTGETPSERYLASLADRTFLNLWSYPGLYKKKGKELADLCVVFGKHIILFSDKVARFQTHDDLNINWQRWFNRAVEKSIHQLEQAERWIRTYPKKLFTDRKAEVPFPWDIGDPATYQFHRVAIARGARDACFQHFGVEGTGGLMFSSSADVSECRSEPFQLGNLCTKYGFVHVLDDYSMDLLLRELDTTTDFIGYLVKKERLVASPPAILASGEEQLLERYLINMNSEGEHDIVLPAEVANATLVMLDGEGFSVASNPQYIAKKRADEPSYLWDEIIAHVGKHALQGSLLESDVIDLGDHQAALRMFAREPRGSRRVLAGSLWELHGYSERRQPVPIRYLQSPAHRDTMYVFVFSSALKTESVAQLAAGLSTYCLVAAWKFRKRFAQVLGLCVHGSPGPEQYSLSMVETANLSEDLCREAESLSRELGILKGRPRFKHYTSQEYPEPGDGGKAHAAAPRFAGKKIGRNAACPCGSGKKFKMCCGGGR